MATTGANLALDAQAIERAGLKAWPGIEVDWDGGWVRRSANGYTKRANSLQCFDPTDSGDAERRLAAACDWFQARGLPPVVRSTPLDSPGIRAALDAGRWRRFDRTHVFAMPLGRHEPDRDTVLRPVTDPEFLAVQKRLQGYDETAMTGLQALLGVLSVPAVGIMVERQGKAVTSGLMAIADGIVVTGNVITDPARRKQGLGAAMMRTGLAWAADQGATMAALNVQADNPGAQALYRSLGFAHQYDYVYRMPGDSA